MSSQSPEPEVMSSKKPAWREIIEYGAGLVVFSLAIRGLADQGHQGSEAINTITATGEFIGGALAVVGGNLLLYDSLSETPSED